MITDLVQWAVGALVVAAVLQDVFSTVLFPGSGHGILRRPLSRWVWRGFRAVAHGLEGERRRDLLAYSGPVLITVNLVAWILLLTVGWALVFHPALGTQIVASNGPTDRGWATALYYSGYALTTLGVGDIVARSDLYRLLTVTEAAIGFATLTMAITYFLSVYSALTQRKVSAGQLHHRTYGTGQAALLLAGLGRDGELPRAADELTTMGAALQHALETHAAYPVLRYFHQRQVYYSLPRMLLVALETETILRSVLDPAHYRQLLGSPSLAGLRGAADQLLDGLVPQAAPVPAGQQETEQWSRRGVDAWEQLRAAGLHVRADADTAAREYVTLRSQWDSRVRRLADTMVYEWSTMEPAH